MRHLGPKRLESTLRSGNNVGGRSNPRPRRRRPVRLRRPIHRNLLPPVVPVAQAAPRTGTFFLPCPSRRRQGVSAHACVAVLGPPAPRSPGLKSVARVCREIEVRVLAGEEAYDAGLSLRSEPSNGMKTHQLERAFRRLIGITPKQYADARRMLRVKSRLKKGDTVTTALYDAGFGSASRLYERAPSHLGMTPAVYRKGGVGHAHSLTRLSIPLSAVCSWAATARGISALYLGESDEDLVAAPRREYPRADTGAGRRGPRATQRLGRANSRAPAGPGTKSRLANRCPGYRVSEARLGRIASDSYGTTSTYTQIAQKIGQPTAVRAVARACAKNPVSVVVPCHRVVRQDGDLAGYRWGTRPQARLLDQESAMTVRKNTKKSANRSLIGYIGSEQPTGNRRVRFRWCVYP